MTAEKQHWPKRPNPALSWLLTETSNQPFIDDVIEELCRRLYDQGLPVDRFNFHARTLHPQFMGARFTWDSSSRKLDWGTLSHQISHNPNYINSPVTALYSREVEFIRQRLDMETSEDTRWYSIYDELRDKGMVEYIALPLRFVGNQDGVCSFTTKRASGFSDEDLVTIHDLMPALAIVAELRISRRIAKNLLNTYVGPFAGEKILRGDIRRGSGETIRAAIWHSDIRSFTALSEKWPREQMISCLNAYFDVVGAPLERHEGEILKFMGDGVMAMFPTDEQHACSRALSAGLEALEGMRELNQRRADDGNEPVNIGVTMHLGDVMWGNIGSSNWLDFTVIGPAVNVVSRMQSLNKQLGRELLFTGEFAGGCGLPNVEVESLGRHSLPGVSDPVEIFSTLTSQ